MKNTKNVSSAIFVIALVFGSWAGAGAQSEITLLAVGPMRVPTQKIVANFEAKTGHKVKVTYGNGVETRRMVAKGQALDVSLIIAPFPGAISSGAIVPGSATLVASILTAVGVPKGRPKPDISTPAAVKKALLAAKSIGYEDPDFTVAGQGPLEALNKLGIESKSPRRVRSNSAPELKASLPPQAITSSKLPSGWKMEISISACSCSATCFPKRTNTTSSAFCRRRFLRPLPLWDSSPLTQATPRLPRRSSNTSPHPKPERSGKKQGTSRIAEPDRLT